jgi:hypothetical protein
MPHAKNAKNAKESKNNGSRKGAKAQRKANEGKKFLALWLGAFVSASLGKVER